MEWQIFIVTGTNLKDHPLATSIITFLSGTEVFVWYGVIQSSSQADLGQYGHTTQSFYRFQPEPLFCVGGERSNQNSAVPTAAHTYIVDPPPLTQLFA